MTNSTPEPPAVDIFDGGTPDSNHSPGLDGGTVTDTIVFDGGTP